MSAIHVTVVGAGIVGLATAYHLTRSGLQVAVIDRDPEGDKASLGNAGAIAVTEVVPASVPGVAWRVPAWLLDPLGPLSVRASHTPWLIPWLVRFAKAGTPREVERISRALAAINSRVYDDLLPMLSDIGLLGDLHRAGALTVYETESGYARDAAEWHCKRSHGIEVRELTGAQAREMEPALGPLVVRAMFTPQWSHVSDPKTLVQALRRWLVRQSVQIRAGDVRKVVAPAHPRALALALTDGSLIPTDRAVIATGAWSARLAAGLGDRAVLESERGYNMTLPNSNITVGRELIFGERKFVATPLACGLRIGGAAEFAGLNAAPNYKRSQRLVDLAARYLPGLQTDGGTSWAGHRPTTPDSLPVIGPSRHQPNVFYAFGHGHLGLTQAATTGRLVSELIRGVAPSIDLAPYSITRFS